MRRYIAFLVAPLIVPVLIVWQSAPFDYWRLPFGVSLVTAYLGMWLLGRPIERFLVTNEATSFWLAPLFGFAAGMIAWYIFFFLLFFLLGNGSFERAFSGFFDLKRLVIAIRLGGLSGAAVGALYWLIARPDLQVRAIGFRDTAKEHAAGTN